MTVTGEEVRLTDPTTGGQKGSKLARFDLMPSAVQRVADAQSVWPLVLSSLDCFWNECGSESSLIYVGRVLADMLGPNWQYTLAEVFGFGAQKYEDRNWERGYPWSWSYAALRRHLALYLAGKRYDNESGLPHLAHALWHVAVLLTFMQTHPEQDDRPHGREK